MVNNRVPLTSRIFRIANKPNTAYAGPVHWDARRHLLMAGDHHLPVPHPVIHPEVVSNQKICDLRFFDQLRGAILSKGRCVVKGTYIDTDEGKMLVEDVIAGTKVLSHDFKTSEMGYFEVLGNSFGHCGWLV